MREKLQRFVCNYGEMCGNLFITQGPGNDDGADVGFQTSPGKKIKESLDLKKRLLCNYVCFTKAKTESLDKSKTVRLGKVISG